MKTVRGVKPDRDGSKSWVVILSDPFEKRQRRFHLATTQEEAVAKKIEVVAKIKHIQNGTMTIPEDVTDIVCWLVKGGQNGRSNVDQKPVTIGHLVDAFLERQRERTATSGDTKISVGRYQDYRFQLNLFRKFCEENKAASLAVAIHADTLEKYKDFAGDHFKSKYSLSHATFSVKSLITWAWETNRIKEMPRNLSTFRKVTLPEPDAQVFTIEEVHSLYNNGSARSKLCILLALNAGYTQMEIAGLKHDSLDLDTGMIEEVRAKIIKKATVPRHVKLWPSTLAALKAQATDPDQSELVLLTGDGNPLVLRQLRGEKVALSDSVAQNFAHVREKANVKGRSFKHFRKTGADLIMNKYPGAKKKTNTELFNMYLAHKPPKMQKHYDPGNWEELYEATDWLGKHLDLFSDGDILNGSG
jgi:integrase